MYFIAKQSLQTIHNYEFEVIKRSIANVETKIHRCPWAEYKAVLKPLTSVDAVKIPLVDILDFCDGRVTSSGFLEIFSGTDYNKFCGLLEVLYASLNTIIALGDSIGYEEIKNGFDVRLPIDLQFEDYSRFFKDINTIFSQYPYLYKDGAQAKFDRIDVGTTWLIFAVLGAPVVLHAVAALVDKAIILKSHFISMKMQEQQLDAMKDAGELRKNQIEIHEKLKEKYLTDAITDIEKAHGELDHEEKERAIHSLELLTGLMIAGTQVYASIESPVDVQSLFPPIAAQSLDTGIKGLIEQKNA